MTPINLSIVMTRNQAVYAVMRYALWVRRHVAIAQGDKVQYSSGILVDKEFLVDVRKANFCPVIFSPRTEQTVKAKSSNRLKTLLKEERMDCPSGRFQSIESLHIQILITIGFMQEISSIKSLVILILLNLSIE